MEKKIDIRKYIDIEDLQKLQNSFSDLTEIEMHISDEEGSFITQPVNMCDFCKFTRVSRIGSQRCRDCDKMGAKQAFEEGHAISFNCHAGLTDFVVPLIVEDNHVGCLAGGQVRLGPLDEEKIRNTAKDINVNPEMYLALARKTPEISEEKFKKVMEFASNITSSISKMATNQLKLERANSEIEYVAKMKADFLANMSHEIRTPMNGVIGMTDLSLREDLPPQAREYLNQIKVSGKTLLTLLNDILDFSKIESGKVNITPEEYEPLSLLSDVTTLSSTRIDGKDIEIIVNEDAMMPRKLYGDKVRIKQVLINIVNNAIKFTKKGKIVINYGFEKKTEEDLILKVSVTDTGIGISKENQKKLFDSFSQVDTKRDRSIEGTGLGLAICKQLLVLMNGDITVESELGKGSTFSFSLPQKIVDNTPGIVLNAPERFLVIDSLENTRVKEQLHKDLDKLSISVMESEKAGLFEMKNATHIFVENDITLDAIEKIIKINENIKIVVVATFESLTEYHHKNVTIIRKPLFLLNLCDMFSLKESEKSKESDYEDKPFTAPDAKVLIVDDNEINLTVAEGLLEPLNMQIETAYSGKEALAKVEKTKYDLIFMYHMMPEMDGVEATRLIRWFNRDYAHIPIIALTANVAAGTKEMFLREGMDDFVPKPIEIKVIYSKIRKWLPKEKVIFTEASAIGGTTGNALAGSNASRSNALMDAGAPSGGTTVGNSFVKVNKRGGSSAPKKSVLSIKELDTDSALMLLGSEELFFFVLNDYYKDIDKKVKKIKDSVANTDIRTFTIEAHSLKSASRQIGAIKLSELAAKLETAGNAYDIEYINENYGEMLRQYEALKQVLAPCFDDEDEEEVVVMTNNASYDKALIKKLLDEMLTATENLDMDEMSAIAGKVLEALKGSELNNLAKSLVEAADNIDVDCCVKIVSDIKNVAGIM